MPRTGKLATLAMLVVGAAMAGFAWWHHFQSGRRCAELWGSDAVVTIRYAPSVEFIALKLASDAASDEATVTIHDIKYATGPAIDILQTRGFVHVRHSLVEAPSIDWQAPPSVAAGNWEFLMRFKEKERRVTLAFDLRDRRVLYLERNRQALLVPHIAAGFEKKRMEWSGGTAPGM